MLFIIIIADVFVVVVFVVVVVVVVKREKKIEIKREREREREGREGEREKEGEGGRLVLHSRVLHHPIFTAANPRTSVNDRKQLQDAVSVNSMKFMIYIVKHSKIRDTEKLRYLLSYVKETPFPCMRGLLN